MSGAGGAPADYGRTVTGVNFTFFGSLDFKSSANSESFWLSMRIR